MYSSKEIIELFSYSRNEQKSFKYLARYMKRIHKKLSEIEKDGEMLKKFALAGLFLTYRAFNHSGGKMTTDAQDYYGDENIHFKRLRVFNEYFDTRIINTQHYLSMINYSERDFILMTLRLRSISRKLYNFVVK